MPRPRARIHLVLIALLCAAIPSFGIAKDTPRVTGVKPANTITNRDLIETVELSGLALSPDGRWLVYRIEQSDLALNIVKTHWVILNIENGLQRRIAIDAQPEWDPSGALLTTKPQWDAESQHFYFLALVGGRRSIWRSGLNGAAREFVTSEADIEAFDLVPNSGRLRYKYGPSRATLAHADESEMTEGVLVDGTRDPFAPLTNNALHGGGFASMRIVDGTERQVGDDGHRTTAECEVVGDDCLPRPLVASAHKAGLSSAIEQMAPSSTALAPWGDLALTIPRNCQTARKRDPV